MSDKDSHCLICRGGSLGFNPQPYNDLLAWHDIGHPRSEVKGNDLVKRQLLGNKDVANPPTGEDTNAKLFEEAEKYNIDVDPPTGGSDSKELEEALLQFEHWIKYPQSTLYRHHDYLRTLQIITSYTNRKVIEELEHLNNFMPSLTPCNNCLKISERYADRITELKREAGE